MKNHIPLTSWACEKKKKPACCHMKVSFRAMRNMGNAAEYFMFFKWKSKILVCLCIFYKKRKLGSKIRAFFFLLIILIEVEKRICLLRLTEIPWNFPGKLLWFQRNRGAPGGFRGVIFAGYVPLASQSPYPIIVFSVANCRLHISHSWANM